MTKRYKIAMRQATAATAFIEGKMQEFLGHLEMQNVPELERVRVDIHALLDMKLDALHAAHTELQREMEIEQRKRRA